MITQECIIDFTLPGTLRKFSVENFLSFKNLTGAELLCPTLQHHFEGVFLILILFKFTL